MRLGLDGRVAVVGGASAGLGYAVAETLAAEGARVVIVSRSEERIERAPVARLLRPEEVAAAVAFLCSEPASGITGVALPVDGGFHRGLI